MSVKCKESTHVSGIRFFMFSSVHVACRKHWKQELHVKTLVYYIEWNKKLQDILVWKSNLVLRNSRNCWRQYCKTLPQKAVTGFHSSQFEYNFQNLIGPLHDPVTWNGINYTGTQVTQWDFQNKGTRTSPALLSFVLEVPLRNLSPSVIYSVPSDRIVQRAYSSSWVQ